jgi:hypothetical protein
MGNGTEINRDEIGAEIAPIKTYADAIVVSNDSDNASAGEYLRRIKTVQKTVKGKFKPLIENAYKTHKELKNFEAEFLSPLDEAERKIKNAIAAFVQKKEDEARKIIEEQQKKIAIAEKKGDEIKVEKLQEKMLEKIEKVAPEKVEGISYAERWSFEIVNEAEIPREFLIPDVQKLGAIARATKGSLKIAGIKFVSEKTIIARKF